MPIVKVIMPSLGDTIKVGTITAWHKDSGEKIQEDEILFDISTDKVEAEIPTPCQGTVKQIFFEEGENVEGGTVIAEIDED